MNIKKPSDFKLRINSIVDSEGTAIDVATSYLIFIIKDKLGHKYEAISDASGTDTRNTAIVDGVLYVTVENCDLYGTLSMSVGIKSADTTYADGYCTTFSQFQPLNIEYV